MLIMSIHITVNGEKSHFPGTRTNGSQNEGERKVSDSASDLLSLLTVHRTERFDKDACLQTLRTKLQESQQRIASLEKVSEIQTLSKYTENHFLLLPTGIFCIQASQYRVTGS